MQNPSKVLLLYKKEYKKNDYSYMLYKLKLKEEGEVPYQKAIYPKMETVRKDSTKWFFCVKNSDVLKI